ncbi:MAG: hypothetical protein Q8R04_00485, partial [Nanoarchaeota archaeon]|nr:hypothetical protein [Nanoarchaeota archaeon]
MLSEKEIKNYFLKIKPDAALEEVNVNFIDIGNLNYVYRISYLGENFFLKNALPEYKNKFPSMEQLPLKHDRLKYEVKALSTLKKIIGKGDAMIPEILFFDDKTNVGIFSEVKGSTIKENIEKNNIEID